MGYLRVKELEEKFKFLNLPPQSLWENLSLSNDFMFGKVMQDGKLCTELLRRILPDFEIGEVVFPNLPKYLRYGFNVMGVRLDGQPTRRDLRDPFIQDLNTKLIIARQNSEWRRAYMRFNMWHDEIAAEAAAEAREKARKEEKFDTARRLLNLGYNEDIIHQVSLLSLDEIRSLSLQGS